MTTERIRRRIEALEAHLREHGIDVFAEQRHLDPGTSERAYWHYGYLVALRDVLGLLPRGDER